MSQGVHVVLPPPSLIITTRETGQVSEFTAPPGTGGLFATFLNDLQTGIDSPVVTSWRRVDHDGHDAIEHGPWEVEIITAFHGRQTLDVRLRQDLRSAADHLELHLHEIGCNPVNPPESLTQFLYGLFAEIADDVDLVAPAGAPFEIDRLYRVFGPWAPPVEPWDIDVPMDLPLEISMNWTYVASDPDAAVQQAIIDHLTEAANWWGDEVDFTITHRLDGERFDALRQGLEELARRGWTIVDQEKGDDERHEGDDNRLLTIGTEVVVEIVPVGPHGDEIIDDADDDGEDNDDDTGDGEGESGGIDPIRWTFDLAVTVDHLDQLVDVLVAGTPPDEALRLVTGSAVLPDGGVAVEYADLTGDPDRAATAPSS